MFRVRAIENCNRKKSAWQLRQCYTLYIYFVVESTEIYQARCWSNIRAL